MHIIFESTIDQGVKYSYIWHHNILSGDSNVESFYLPLYEYDHYFNKVYFTFRISLRSKINIMVNRAYLLFLFFYSHGLQKI